VLYFGHKASSQREDAQMQHPPETKVVDTYRIACDGGEGALGHPRVWLQIPKDTGWVECGYCDCKFIHKDHQDKA
jgi:uncharacterized Zn-finger protein